MTLKVKITSDNYEKFKYRFIVEDKKLVLLDIKTIKKYIGKTVDMRSPMFCKDKNFCEKCYGRFPFMINIKDIGLSYSIIGETLKNLSMKKFHDATISLTEVNIEDAIKKI